MVNCGTATLSSVQFNWNAITGATGYNYSYTINNGAAVTGTTTTTTLTINSLKANDAVAITVTPVGSSCTAAGTGNCTAANCPAVTNNTIGSDQSICSGTAPSMLDGSIPNISPATAFTYQWQLSADGISWTDITGASLKDFTPTATLTRTTYYRRLVQLAGCLDAISNIVTVTVSPNQH